MTMQLFTIKGVRKNKNVTERYVAENMRDIKPLLDGLKVESAEGRLLSEAERLDFGVSHGEVAKG